MNQFPTLIEYLLLNHNYVVVPELGTFIAQEMDAQRNEAEETFLPPFRSVRFNVELKQDDRLLLDAMTDIYKVSPEQASQMLTTWIADFHQALEDNGCQEFGTIGTFTMEEDGAMLFISQESGITTPEYYGLDVFHLREMAPVQKTRTVPLAASMETNEREITIRINRRIANYVVAASAAILLFWVFNSPMAENRIADQRSSLKELLMPLLSAPKGKFAETTTPKASTATLDDGKAEAEAATKARPQAAQAAPQSLPADNEEAAQANTTEEAQQAKPAEATPTTEPSAPAQQAKQTQQAKQAQQTQQAPEETAPEQAGYCIVMASSIPLTNAERFVERLKAEGFPEARILQGESMLRVVVGHYASKEEANHHVNDIRQRSDQYRSAWILHL